MNKTSSSVSHEIDSFRQKEESIKVFFSIVAHDLRGYLAGIRNFSDLITRRADLSGNAQIVHYAELIFKSSSNALVLLDNMLEWSRLQLQGCLEINQSAELNEVVEEEICSLLSENKDKYVHFQRIIPVDFLIPVQKCLLKSLIRNLLTNAFKFSYDGGEVLLTAQQENNHALIRIQDFGIGMDQEMTGNLFDIKKLQVRMGTKGEKGSGIGLFICQEIIHLHKGSLHVISAPGAGTEFIIEIPLIP